MSESALGVAIVSYNTASLLRRCLTSVLTDTRGPVLVVDNQSTDGSADLVRGEFSSVRVRAQEDNRGYGAAANVAIRELGTRYVLLLNADTELTSRTVESLAAYLDDHPTVAIAGPRIVNAAGTYEQSAHRFPTATSLLLHARWWPGPQSARPRAPSAHHPPERRLRPLAALARWNEWRPRPVDYQEEIDLCYRLRAAGWEIHYAPVATVLHVGGASTGQRATETFGQFVRSTQRFAQLPGLVIASGASVYTGESQPGAVGWRSCENEAEPHFLVSARVRVYSLFKDATESRGVMRRIVPVPQRPNNNLRDRHRSGVDGGL
jgi:N-acetylglucosaminyl-diphospho-decaprenol L-rhamnosyltransferase